MLAQAEKLRAARMAVQTRRTGRVRETISEGRLRNPSQVRASTESGGRWPDF